ncbi:MAG: sortase [Acidimicrobiia bacterium]|nr:sortase [Acidimicrobiia bacterium]
MRRLVRIIAWTMVWSGGMTLGLVGYQLFVTDLINHSVQAEARDELVDELEFRRQDLPAPVVVEESPSPTVATSQPDPISYQPEDVDEEGVPIADFRIPRIGLDAVVFEGVSPATLRNGPGHMPWTPVPGQPGNAVISGHRTTYGAPFYDLDLLEPGDEIEIDTAIGTHMYTVRETVIVTPTDVWVTDTRPGAWLTLTTCHPKLSARERLIVFAELTGGPNLEYVEFLATQTAGA